MDRNLSFPREMRQRLTVCQSQRRSILVGEQIPVFSRQISFLMAPKI